MKTPKKSHRLNLRNEPVVKKAHKHDANLQKNSVLFFQIGLIVCLLVSYGLFEMKFDKTIPKIVPDEAYTEPEYFIDYSFVPETPSEKPIVQTKSVSKYLEPEIVPDDAPVMPFDVPDLPVKSADLDPASITTFNVPDDDPVPINFIEQVPVYPGCEKEKTNDAKRKCMSDKITQLVKKQFDTNLGGTLGLSGRQVILTQFKIDKTGHVTDIQARAPHPKLKDEAERVINKIPEMTPGKQQDKNVGVIYSLPIVFEVQN